MNTTQRQLSDLLKSYREGHKDFPTYDELIALVDHRAGLCALLRPTKGTYDNSDH